MKKLMVMVFVLIATSTMVKAGNEQPIEIAKMPVTAQTFIKTYFAKADVSLAKVDTDFMDRTYDVIFTNGDKVEFNKKGVWKEVQCRNSGGVPQGIIPVQICNHVKAKYPNAKILEIDRDKYDYEVRLSGGLELTFDKKFNLIDIDN